MVHETRAGPLDPALAGVVGGAAVGVAGVAAGILGLALLAELLRRRNRALRVLALLDAVLPRGARTAAVSLLAVAATFVGVRPAAADESVRGWLGRPTTSTSRPPAVATPEALDQLVAPVAPPAVTGPVVLQPRAIGEHPDVVAAPPAAPSPPVVPTPPVTPTPSVPNELPTYVVQPGDCLWAIAARRLGPRADGRAIDAGWRRIYDTNRAAVGDDPNLIHIGLVLLLPPLDAQL